MPEWNHEQAARCERQGRVKAFGEVLAHILEQGTHRPADGNLAGHDATVSTPLPEHQDLYEWVQARFEAELAPDIQQWKQGRSQTR